jgi:hypothetical protein
MKTKLLLFFFAAILCQHSAQGQLLTEIQDSTEDVRENYDPDFFVALGHTGRVVLGYKQMRNYFEDQGFDLLNLQEFFTFGAGFRFANDFYLSLGIDQSFRDNDPRDLELRNGNVLVLEERKNALHLLLGYRFWQKRYTNLVFNLGFSWQQNRATITERPDVDFDFNAINPPNPEGVRSWPVFFHRQGALHCAIQVKFNYPRRRWWSTDGEINLGFVSGLNSKPWTVEPGQAVNTPTDRVQYIYISGLYHFFSR